MIKKYTILNARSLWASRLTNSGSVDDSSGATCSTTTCLSTESVFGATGT